jgi:hypothetical protein
MNKNINFAWSQSFNLRTCLAVAQLIEQRSDSAAGCGFESRQPDHTLEALGISHLGLLCFNLFNLECAHKEILKGNFAKLVIMLSTRSPLSKAAGSLAIVFALFSTVFVIAHSCHSNQSEAAVATHTSSGHSHSSHGSENAVVDIALFDSALDGSLESSLLKGISTGVFFLVLLLGGKFLLKVLSVRYRIKFSSFRSNSKLLLYERLMSFGLSLPQLGVFRI